MKRYAVALAFLALVLFVAAPVMAALDLYGSVRMQTYWLHEDSDQDKPEWNDDDSDDGLIWDLQGNTRLGVRGTVNDVYGRIELGIRAEAGDIYTRLAFGSYDFEGGSLLVGQNYNPYTWFSDQVSDVDLGNIAYGALYDGRQPQIRLNLGGLYIAAIKYKAINQGGGDLDPYLPKLCVGYDFQGEDFMVGGGAAYNTYDEEGGLVDDGVDSYLLYARFKAALGMVKLQGSAHYGQNLGNFGISRRDAASAVIEADGDIQDTDCYGGYLQAGFALGSATVYAGAGYVASDNDEYEDPDEEATYYINVKIPIAKGFFIQPEFAYYDGLDDPNGDEEDDAWWLGAKWQMDF